MGTEKRKKGEEEDKMIPPKSEMAAKPTSNAGAESAPNPKADDSNLLKQNDRNVAKDPIDSNSNNANKVKSCKGCLYYYSQFKNDSPKPLCVGLTRSLPNVPLYIVGQSKVEASEEGRSLIGFKYACVGYSLYPNQKEQASSEQQNHTELPVCVGLEILVVRRANTAESSSTPSHIHNREDGNGLPQRRTPKPTHSAGEYFFSRFTRNANLVANGVVKNVRKVGESDKTEG